MFSKADNSILNVTSGAQRKVLTSPLRQEILSQFAGEQALSVADLASRMGRPATALYYHVSQLLELGFLEPAGERRKGKRFETLYRPTAQRFEIQLQGKAAWDDAIESVKVAQRMALRDMSAAFESGRAREEGPERNCIAFRLQGGMDKETLAGINEHIDAILDLVSLACQEAEPDAEADFVSLTLALMPLRGRRHGSDS